MKVGDLVKIDAPRQRVNGKVGLIVGRTIRHLHDWMRDSPRKFYYDVMVEGEVRHFIYDELLEQDDWEHEAR